MILCASRRLRKFWRAVTTKTPKAFTNFQPRVARASALPWVGCEKLVPTLKKKGYLFMSVETIGSFANSFRVHSGWIGCFPRALPWAGIRERLRRLQGVMNKGFVKYINALAKPRPGLSSGRCSQLISSMRHGDSCKQSRAELFPIRPLHARRQTVVK